MKTRNHEHSNAPCDPFSDSLEQVAGRIRDVYGFQDEPNAWRQKSWFLAEEIQSFHPMVRSVFLEYWNEQRYDADWRVRDSRWTLGELIKGDKDGPQHPLRAFADMSQICHDAEHGNRTIEQRRSGGRWRVQRVVAATG